MTLLLLSMALFGQRLPVSWIDWQPDLVATQPWRAWTAVAVHYSGMHLAGNLAGTALVGALGWVSRLPMRATLAWCLAWPLTHWGLLLQPSLSHYGGLSGVVHAGVAIVSAHLVFNGRGRQRPIGALMFLLLVGKVVSEEPWGAPLRYAQGWDIALAPLAHATGALAGLFFVALLELAHRRRGFFTRSASKPL